MKVDQMKIENANHNADMKERLVWFSENETDEQFARLMNDMFGLGRDMFANVAKTVAASFDILNLIEDLLACSSDVGQEAIRKQIRSLLAQMAVSTWCLAGRRNARVTQDDVNAVNALKDTIKAMNRN